MHVRSDRERDAVLDQRRLHLFLQVVRHQDIACLVSRATVVASSRLVRRGAVMCSGGSPRVVLRAVPLSAAAVSCTLFSPFMGVAISKSPLVRTNSMGHSCGTWHERCCQ